MFHRNDGEKGQSLIEVLIVLVVGAIMLSGLSVVVISSMRNAQYAESQIQATKYAQEAIDQIQSIRDANLYGSVKYFDSGVTKDGQFSDFFTLAFNETTGCGTNGRYFNLVSGTVNGTTQEILQEVPCGSSNIDLGDKGLTRQILITDQPGTDMLSGQDYYKVEKNLDVKVNWHDGAGEHSSNLETLLTPQD